MNKAAIIIDENLPTGLLANAVACITTGLFLEGRDYVGESITGSDVTYIPITKIPILILKPGKTPLVDLFNKIKASGVKYMAFTSEAQTTTNYEEYKKRVEGKGIEDVTLVGLGIVGSEEIIKSLTGSLPMLR